MTWGEVPSRRPSGGDHRTPPWMRTILIGIGVLILIALLVERETINKIGFGAFSVTFSPAGGSASGAGGNAPAAGGSATAHSTSGHSSQPERTTVGYLYTMAPSAGGPVQRGVTSLGGRTFNHSIWLPFQVYCCGTEQSVTYQVPAGYHYLQAFIGQSSLNGDQNGYAMMFSIRVNGTTVVNSRQALLGDPPIPVKVRLPSGSASVVIDVNAACNNFTCAGVAVIGNARLIPPR